MDSEAVAGETNSQQMIHGEDRAASYRAELVDRIGKVARADGRFEPLQGLFCNRISTRISTHGVSFPAFCVVAQGSKAVFLGSERHRYDPAHYLLFTVELPYVSQVLDASPERPYLSLRLNLDPALVSSVMVESGHQPIQSQINVRATNVSPLDVDLLDATVRLVRLLDTPEDAPVLAPLIKREIVYRLLRGNQGPRLRYVIAQQGRNHRIAQAIQRIHNDFDQQLRVDDIAQELGMSTSSFHHHFKAVTAMSPLQFQKQLQLQEARRLLLAEEMDAASAGFRVGYNDPAHFNREYKRLFGEPPMRDVERLRKASNISAD